jgi:hypothetical protein
MPIIGYGEDGLTYSALTDHLDTVLRELEGPEHSRCEDCLLFFRPSFGRAGGLGRAEFGEFDAILATGKAVYLVESKWDGSGILLDGAVVLEFRQILRHQIFGWILDMWRSQNPASWNDFATQNQNAFSEKLGGKPLAPIHLGSRTI